MAENIEITMDNIVAYSVLKQASFPHSKYPETWDIIESVMDEEQKCLMVAPAQLASKLDGADREQPVSDDIFCFMEKAYKDALSDGVNGFAYDLVQLFYFDRYGHVDYRKAVKYFRIGLAAGDERVELDLGRCYFEGAGVKQDYEKAFQLLSKQAFAGNSAFALYLIGEMYWNGYYVKKDHKAAFRIFQNALKISSKDGRTEYCQADIYMKLGDSFMEMGTDNELALNSYQEAEKGFYVQRKALFKGTAEKLKRVVKKQGEARREIHKALK